MKWLFICLVLALGLRLYHLTDPLADWHSFRQADTASVAREYVKHGINWLYPEYHDLSNIQSGRPNPQGLRLVEFPLIPALVALTYRPFTSMIPLHVWYRLVNICFSLGSLSLLYLIARRLYGPRPAVITAIIFALLPFNLYYSRAILPEIPMVFFILLTLWLALQAFNRTSPARLLAMGLTGALALLVKPVAAFFLLPLLAVAFYSIKAKPNLAGWWLAALGLMITPLLAWRRWLSRFPEGVPASEWLLNGNGIRFRPAWFRWLFYERLTKLILGWLALLPFMAGLIALFHRPKKSVLALPFILSLGLGGLLYLLVFATGNVQHDYYQIPQLPFVCLILGLGLDWLLGFKRMWLSLLAIGCLILGLFLSWRTVATFYHINHWAIVHAGQAVDRLTPPDALVVAPFEGDTAFLYQTNRRGWPIGHDLDQKIQAGAAYYVTVNFDSEAAALKMLYPVVQATGEYLILDLTRPFPKAASP